MKQLSDPFLSISLLIGIVMLSGYIAIDFVKDAESFDNIMTALDEHNKVDKKMIQLIKNQTAIIENYEAHLNKTEDGFIFNSFDVTNGYDYTLCNPPTLGENHE